MLEQLERLIKETEQWREYHRQNHNVIDAAACAIRLVALKEVKALLKDNK